MSCCSSNAGPFGRSVVFHCDIPYHISNPFDKRIYDFRKFDNMLWDEARHQENANDGDVVLSSIVEAIELAIPPDG